MASVYSKPGAKGRTLWYGVIYLNGAHRQFPLFERDGRTRPTDRTRALTLAGRLEHQLKTGNPKAQLKATRRSIFRTVWPLFYDTQVVLKAENTQSDYRYAFEGHLRHARFARKRVCLITHTDILDYVNSMKGTLSPHTLNNETGMLAQFFDYAQQNGYWDGPVNPARAMGVRQPLTPNPIVYLSKPEHIALFLDSFDPAGEQKYATLSTLLLLTGIRWSEARSLLWSNTVIDDPKWPHLFIESTAVGNGIQPWLKTKAGHRWVGLCPTLVKLLRDWRANTTQGGTLASEKTRLGIDPSDSLVFPSDAGTLLSPGNFRKPLRQFDTAKLAAHALDPSFPLALQVHGLRHSTSMLLQREGVNLIHLAHWMGHSKKALLGSAATYTHAEAQRENPIVAALVERSIQGSRKALTKQHRSSPRSTAAPTPPPVAKSILRKSPKAAAAATAAKRAIQQRGSTPRATPRATPAQRRRAPRSKP